MPRRRRRASALNWIDSAHQGCQICTPYVEHRRQANVEKIHRVAASLRGPQLVAGEAALTKQETPDPARSEASTAHPVCDTEVRAAGAQSDTRL